MGKLAGYSADAPCQAPNADAVEASPPSYMVSDGVCVQAHRLFARNAEAVRKMADLINNHAEKLALLTFLQTADNDPFVIGYLGGIIDALCQTGGILDNYQRTGMVERLYAHVFDNGFASDALDTLMHQQQSNPRLQEGLEQGGEDFLAFMNGQSKSFIGLFQHLSNNSEQT